MKKVKFLSSESQNLKITSCFETELAFLKHLPVRQVHAKFFHAYLTELLGLNFLLNLPVWNQGHSFFIVIINRRIDFELPIR